MPCSTSWASTQPAGPRPACDVVLLSPAAAVARISLVKPDKARAIEDMLIQAARRGQIGEKVSEERLIELLEQVRPSLLNL